MDPKKLERYFDLKQLLTRTKTLLPTLQADSLAKIAAETYLRSMA